VLDVGCGWGSFAIHAAARHGVHVTGITLSEPQAAVARSAARSGLGDRVDIRVSDYRELADERFDAIARIGMVEHVGERNIDAYARQLAACCARRAGCSTTASRGCATATGGGPVLGALRVPGRRAAAPVAHPARARGAGWSPTTSRASATTMRPRSPTGCGARGSAGRRRAAGRSRARARLAALLRTARKGFQTRFMSI
jgi:SAM-dependent methyltransferase